MSDWKKDLNITDAKSGAAFPVRVTTRANESEVVGIDEEKILRVRLMASPAGDPKANEELIKLLATYFEVEESRVEIVAGEDGREKLISIEGVNAQDIEAKLNPS